MQLPDDVLFIIREYSKPLTRPDWRTYCPLTNHLLYNSLHHEYAIKENKPFVLKNRVFNHNTLFLYRRALNHLKTTYWGRVYIMTRSFGVDYASCYFKLPIHELYRIPDIINAQDYYIHGLF
jgi:hypothetical protein